MKELKMRTTNIKHLIIATCALAPLSAWATLGESTSSIMNDQIALKATATQNTSATNNQLDSTVALPYQTNTITTPEKTVITQYSANGTVFAVSWHGPKVPDQNQLFGKYFNEYQTATPSYKSLSARKVNNSDFVSLTNGWMGHYEGKALIPSLAPANVTINSIK